MNRVPKKKNPNLLNELLQEIDYFLWLSVQALERMYEKNIIMISDDSEKAVTQLRCDSDTVQAFLMEACVLEEDGRIERRELYNKYIRYCEDVERQSLKRNNFYKSLRLKGYKEKKSGGNIFFKGILGEKYGM